MGWSGSPRNDWACVAFEYLISQPFEHPTAKQAQRYYNAGIWICKLLLLMDVFAVLDAGAGGIRVRVQTEAKGQGAFRGAGNVFA